MEKSPFQDDLDVLKANLGFVPEPLPRPVLIVVSGLPGSGKSYFSRNLARRFPIAIVETDVMRRVLFPSPTYSATESARLFGRCHALIEEMLRKGVPVLFDATNLIEFHRERLYNIAHKTNAKLVLVRVQAPPEVVSRRLQRREEGAAREDNSSAGWAVYRRMAPTVEPIRRNYHSVDTSRDVAPVIEKIAREIERWVRV